MIVGPDHLLARCALPRLAALLPTALTVWGVAACSPGGPPPGSASIEHRLDYSITVRASPAPGDSLRSKLLSAPTKGHAGTAWIRWRLRGGEVGLLYFRDDGMPREYLARLSGAGSLLFRFVALYHDYVFVLHLVGRPGPPVAVTYIKD